MLGIGVEISENCGSWKPVGIPATTASVADEPLTCPLTATSCRVVNSGFELACESGPF